MGSFETSDGVELHFSDFGEGVPLVFSAGWAMDSMWWANQLGLAEQFRVVILDPRAQGASHEVERGIRLGRQAKDLRELIEHLDLRDLVHVAWSRSTGIALAYWELFGGDRLSGLVLIGVTPSISRRADWEWGYAQDPGRFQEEILADHEGVVRSVVDAVFVTRPDDETFEEMVRTTMLTSPLAGARMLEDHGVIDWRDMLETITVPTLVCVGRHDRNAPMPAGEFVAAAIPGARLEVFEQSAHAPFYEQPEEFNRLLVEFVLECTGQDGGRL